MAEHDFEVACPHCTNEHDYTVVCSDEQKSGNHLVENCKTCGTPFVFGWERRVTAVYVLDDGTRPKRANGGKAGGRARAAKLSPERRSEIARAGAKARWSKQPSTGHDGNG